MIFDSKEAEQVNVVRNFPHHSGDFDQELAEKECPNSYAEQCAFRAGWSCAIEVLNDKLSKIKDKNAKHNLA